MTMAATKASDPISASLARLDDPDLWEVESAVPVFVPHVRDEADGSIRYEVTPDDIGVIAAETEWRAKAGTIPVQTLGHRNPDPDADETNQPPVVGFGRNFRVGTWDGKPAVVCDLFTRKDFWDEAKQYPYRSVEYRHKARLITGVPRLKREPYLDVGTLVYAGHSDTFHYAMPPDRTPARSPVELYQEIRERMNVVGEGIAALRADMMKEQADRMASSAPRPQPAPPQPGPTRPDSEGMVTRVLDYSRRTGSDFSTSLTAVIAGRDGKTQGEK
jgi:hypothetical protein